jgi:hypothetical protein
MTPTEIARRLSPAQKRAVMKASRWPDGRVVGTLQRMGLLAIGRDVRTAQSWSPLGLEVRRAILAAQEQSK